MFGLFNETSDDDDANFFQSHFNKPKISNCDAYADEIASNATTRGSRIVDSEASTDTDNDTNAGSITDNDTVGDSYDNALVYMPTDITGDFKSKLDKLVKNTKAKISKEFDIIQAHTDKIAAAIESLVTFESSLDSINNVDVLSAVPALLAMPRADAHKVVKETVKEATFDAGRAAPQFSNIGETDENSLEILAKHMQERRNALLQEPVASPAFISNASNTSNAYTASIASDDDDASADMAAHDTEMLKKLQDELKMLNIDDTELISADSLLA